MAPPAATDQNQSPDDPVEVTPGIQTSGILVWVDVGCGRRQKALPVYIGPNSTIRQFSETALRRVIAENGLPKRPWVIWDVVLYPPGKTYSLSTEEQLNSTVYSHGIQAGDRLQMILRAANFTTLMVQTWPCDAAEAFMFTDEMPTPDPAVGRVSHSPTSQARYITQGGLVHGHFISDNIHRVVRDDE